jgi:hypothetical protein
VLKAPGSNSSTKKKKKKNNPKSEIKEIIALIKNM